ncbi:MAG TPA: glycosyltransferase family 4 protein [Verrucomicrobiae bacterium]|nr:glycosyltransferase family 4 protein [Verrucomicrobiae bacterium]
MKERRIVHVMDYGGSTGGSFIPSLTALARAMRSRGDRFVVLATEIPGATWPRELQDNGAEVHFVRSDQDVSDCLREVRPDIVHSHFGRFDLAVARERSSRVFWHVHSYPANPSATVKLRNLLKYRFLGAGVRALVAVSDVTRSYCIARGAPRDRVRVVYNGIDTERFRPPAPQERARARETFGIAPQDRVILFFERVPYKGGAVLNGALQRLPECRLLVAGGTAADRARFGRAPRVIQVERAADARQLHWAADALAFPSSYEAFGYVLAEALACGLPVAASDIPIVHDIAADVDGVFTFQVGSVDGLACALDKALAAAPSAAGRERMTERFSLQRWTADMLALYDN